MEFVHVFLKNVKNVKLLMLLYIAEAIKKQNIQTMYISKSGHF